MKALTVVPAAWQLPPLPVLATAMRSGFSAGKEPPEVQCRPARESSQPCSAPTGRVRGPPRPIPRRSETARSPVEAKPGVVHPARNLDRGWDPQHPSGGIAPWADWRCWPPARPKRDGKESRHDWRERELSAPRTSRSSASPGPGRRWSTVGDIEKDTREGRPSAGRETRARRQARERRPTQIAARRGALGPGPSPPRDPEVGPKPSSPRLPRDRGSRPNAALGERAGRPTYLARSGDPERVSEA